MIRIEPENWSPATYARANQLTDILRHPTDAYAHLSEKDKDNLRQSQIEPGELVRVLGQHQSHALIMKSDQVVGWVTRSDIVIDVAASTFESRVSAELSAEAFFEQWRDTPYVWGGVTRLGIDCSGLTQRYYRDVLDQAIPKNSYDQRRSGTATRLDTIQDHDLVFCTRIGGRGIHHVGIYLNGDIWHAHGERGVISQTLGEFLADYAVLEVVTFSLRST